MLTDDPTQAVAAASVGAAGQSGGWPHAGDHSVAHLRSPCLLPLSPPVAVVSGLVIL